MAAVDPPVQSSSSDLNLNISAVGGEVVNLASVDAVPSRGGGTARAVYVGVSGDVKVDFADGTTGIVLTAAAGGGILPVAVTKIYKTGTTATNLVFLY